MTTETKTKIKPVLYIFETLEGGKTINAGAAFNHKTGKGFNLVVDGKRYVAFPPKAKSEEVESI